MTARARILLAVAVVLLLSAWAVPMVVHALADPLGDLYNRLGAIETRLSDIERSQQALNEKLDQLRTDLCRAAETGSCPGR